MFVYVFTFVPIVVLSLGAALLGTDQIIGGDGIALLLVGLAVIVTASDLIYLRRQHVLRSVWLAIMAAPVLAKKALKSSRLRIKTCRTPRPAMPLFIL